MALGLTCCRGRGCTRQRGCNADCSNHTLDTRFSRYVYEHLSGSCTLALTLYLEMASDSPLCYYPRGAVAVNHTPCNASATQSWCCHQNDFCLSNGHCLQASQVYANRIARGSCTDRTWNSAACPFECADGTPHPSFTIVHRVELADDNSP